MNADTTQSSTNLQSSLPLSQQSQNISSKDLSVQNGFDDSLQELPSPSPMKSSSQRSMSDVSMLNDSSLSELRNSVIDNDLIFDTPKALSQERNSFRKRILSSQDSINPRSPKKIKPTEDVEKPITNTELLLKLKDDLTTTPDKEECLRKLLKIKVSVEDLLETGIGKCVKKLKKEQGEIGALASKIYHTWMNLVENHITETNDQNNADSGTQDSTENVTEEREDTDQSFHDEPPLFEENFSLENIEDVNQSLQFDSSFIGEEQPKIEERFENTPPVNKRLLLDRTPKCTPLPNYDQLLSPELKAELSKYGLKVVPRKKAIMFLKHIYDETHPYVNEKGNVVKTTPLVQKDKKKKPPSRGKSKKEPVKKSKEVETKSNHKVQNQNGRSKEVAMENDLDIKNRSRENCMREDNLEDNNDDDDLNLVIRQTIGIFIFISYKLDSS